MILGALFSALSGPPESDTFEDQVRIAHAPNKIWPPEVLCGPSSLAVAAKKLGIDARVQEIANRVTMTRRGTSLAELARVAREMGLTAQGFYLPSTELLTQMNDGVLAIAEVRKNHFGAVWPAGDGDLWLASYPSPLKRINHVELESTWNSRVLTIKRADTRPVFCSVTHPSKPSICLTAVTLGVVLLWGVRKYIRKASIVD